MLSDRERRELLDIERRLKADDTAAAGAPAPPTPAPPPRPRLWSRKTMLTAVTAAVLLLPAVLLLGTGLIIVLLLALAAVAEVWSRHGQEAGQLDGSP